MNPVEPGSHPSREVVARFLRGASARVEARQVVRHLLAGCVECRRTVGADSPRRPALEPSPEAAPGDHRRPGSNLLPFHPPPPARDGYGPVFERVTNRLTAREREFAAERTAVAALRERLDAEPPERRRGTLRADPAFHRWALVDSLIADSRIACVSDADRALELAELALDAAARLDVSRYSAATVADVSARAWSRRGNALRILGRFREAEESLVRATELLERGSGDPAEACRLLMLKSALRVATRRYDEADALLARALRQAVRSADRNLQGDVLMRQARLAQWREDADAAIDLIERGLALLDPDHDPRLLLVAHHNMALLMVETGRCREALERMEEIRALHLRLGGRLDFLRFRWLEGRTYAGLGWLRQAASHYQAVRSGFLEAGLAFDLAQVSLDLAAVYAQEGRHAEVRALVDEVLPIFRSREAHQEVLATLLVLRDAARRDLASIELVRRLADRLRAEGGTSALGFRPLDGTG